MAGNNFSYSFKLGGVKFRAEIDSSLSAQRRRSDDSYPTEKLLHYHPMHELFFVFDEPLRVNTAHGVLVFQSSIVCIPPFVEHYSERASDYRFLFSFDTGSAHDAALAEFFRDGFAREEIFSFGDLSPEVRSYLDELCRLTGERGDGLDGELASSVLKLLLYHVWSAGHGEPRPAVRTESYLVTIEQIVNDYSHNPEVDIDLGFVADALHLSKKQTSRIIHKYFKKPFSALKLDKRLEYSRYLLVSTDIPISEIASRAGFASENYFYSTFKRKFGTTPLAYRKNAAGK